MILRSQKLLFILFLVCSNLVLAQDIDSIIKAAPNQEALWSVTVRDSEGKILEALNLDQLIVPASNQKLFTTAAVLDGLESDFRYTTNIYGDGELIDSVWYGDLIIRGSGDPSISGFMYDGDQEYVFKSFLRQLKEIGISKISGSIAINERYFDGQKYPKGWDWDDLTFYYGVEVSALSYNNNAIDIIVRGIGEIGDKPVVEHFPEFPIVETVQSGDFGSHGVFVRISNQQQIIDEGKEYDELYVKKAGENLIVLGSRLPKNYIEEESLAISDAEIFFRQSFQNFLLKAGILDTEILTSRIMDFSSQKDLDLYEVLASHTSEPLSKLIEWTNKESDNFYTEMMLKTLAAEKVGTPGTFENGIKEVRSFLGRMGIDTTYVVMKDGSGMASGNFTKTSILSEFLAKMKNHPEFPSFYNSMSIAGIDGTIAHRMKGTKLYNNFRGKSGYVGGARTLSGYFITASGEELIVSFATNNYIGKVKPIDSIHEQILEYLYAKY